MQKDYQMIFSLAICLGLEAWMSENALYCV